MSTTTTVPTHAAIIAVKPTSAEAPTRSVELVDIHARAGHLVAELSTGPAWDVADQITARLIAEAEAVATPGSPADAVVVPAVVRCRELAAAQRRMVLTLEGDDRIDVGEAAVVRARALLAELGDLASEQRGTLRR